MKILHIGLGHSIHLKKWTEYIELGSKNPTEQVIFSCRLPEWKLTDDKYPYYFYRFDAYLWPKMAFDWNELNKKAKKIIKKESPDICIVHDVVHCAPAIISIRRYSGIPIITILWNAMDLPGGKHYNKCFPYTCEALSVSNKIMGTELLNKLSSEYYNIPRAKYSIIRPMVDTRIFYNKKGGKERKEVSFIRGPGELYFPKEFIKAVTLILREFPITKFNFFITHDNPINIKKQEECKRYAEELGVRDKINFIDRQLTYEEYAETLNDSLISVSIKADDPDVPFSFIAAALCGSIVIASDTKWIRQRITHGKHAFLTKHNYQDIAHHTIEALKHPELAEVFYKNNLEKFRDYALEKQLPHYLETFSEYASDSHKSVFTNRFSMLKLRCYPWKLSIISKLKNIKTKLLK